MANADHFYTTSLDEANAAIRDAGYNAEGTEGFVLPKRNMRFGKMTPIYRFYNGHDHFYCRDKAEGDGAKGYTFERIAFYVRREAPDPGFESYWIPLFRMYSHKDTEHFYTTAQNRSDAVKAGYNDEGILGWVMTAPPAAPDYASPLFRLYKHGTSKDSWFSMKTLGTVLMVIEVLDRMFKILGPIFSSGDQSQIETKTDSQGNTLMTTKSVKETAMLA